MKLVFELVAKVQRMLQHYVSESLTKGKTELYQAEKQAEKKSLKQKRPAGLPAFPYLKNLNYHIDYFTFNKNDLFRTLAIKVFLKVLICNHDSFNFRLSKCQRNIKIHSGLSIH